MVHGVNGINVGDEEVLELAARGLVRLPDRRLDLKSFLAIWESGGMVARFVGQVTFETELLGCAQMTNRKSRDRPHPAVFVPLKVG